MWNVLKNKCQSIIEKCDDIASEDNFTNVYGLSRSLFALGTLLTLLFNSNYTLFTINQYKKSNLDVYFSDYNLFYLFDYEGLYLSKIIGILILLLVILGYYPRITGVLHWWVSFSFLNSATLIEGGDQITANVVLFLIPITLLDTRKNHWRISEKSNPYANFIAYIIFYIITIQIAVLYLQSAIEKPYKVEEWADGTAIYYWLNNNLFGLTDYSKIIINPILNIPTLLFIINWSVIIFELTLFGAFFMEGKKKQKLLKYGILFHFAIIILFGLVTFFIAMCGALILYLYPKNKKLTFKYLKL